MFSHIGYFHIHNIPGHLQTILLIWSLRKGRISFKDWINLHPLRLNAKSVWIVYSVKPRPIPTTTVSDLASVEGLERDVVSTSRWSATSKSHVTNSLRHYTTPPRHYNTVSQTITYQLLFINVSMLGVMRGAVNVVAALSRLRRKVHSGVVDFDSTPDVKIITPRVDFL